MPTVSLVNPKETGAPWRRGILTTMEDAQPRHSLTHLSAALKEAGFRVGLLDQRMLKNWEEFDAVATSQKPDFACITAHTQEAEQALETAKRIKQILPECKVVAGGIHFSMFPQNALETGAVDYVIRGEGEISLPRLLQGPVAHQAVTWGIPPDLDTLPFEDRTLYPDYEDRIRFPIWDFPTPIVDILTGRGCPWQCRFCCGPGEQNLYTKPSRRDPERRSPSLRRRSVEHVMAELRALDRRYGFRAIIFHDDQFLIRREWSESFCEEMMRAGYPARGVKWWAACRSDVICRFPEMIERMCDAGLSIISIGFESFSDPILDWMNKGADRETNLEAARICHSLGLDIYANVMFGIPRQDGRWRWKDDVETYESVREVNPRYLSPSYFSPVPGSWFYDWALEADLMLDVSPEKTGNRTPFDRRIDGVDYSRLDPLVTDLSRRYSRPWYDRMRFYRYRAGALVNSLVPSGSKRE